MSSDLAPHQSKESDPISPRLHPRSSRFVRFARVLISRSGASHQPKAPPSEFNSCKNPDLKKQGRPISPRLHPWSSRDSKVLRVSRVLILRSAAAAVFLCVVSAVSHLRVHVRIRAWAVASAPKASANEFGVTTYCGVSHSASPLNAASANRHRHLMWRQQFGVTTQWGVRKQVGVRQRGVTIRRRL